MNVKQRALRMDGKNLLLVDKRHHPTTPCQRGQSHYRRRLGDYITAGTMRSLDSLRNAP